MTDRFSGPRLVTFRKGWALKMFGGEKAHYFERAEVGIVRSLCGQVAYAGRLFGPGNFDKCRRCEKKWHKSGTTPATTRMGTGGADGI